MEALAIRNIDAQQVREGLKYVRDSRGNDGKGLAGVEAATGITRSILSGFVNNGYAPSNDRLEKLADYLEKEYGFDMERDVEEPAPAARAARLFGAEGEIYRTDSVDTAFGTIDNHREVYRTCVMIGAPGIGKTTILREYAHQRENTYYIDCWPYMGAQDIMESIAEAMGFGLRPGSVMNRTRQILAELNQRPGALLIYDEAENLIGSNARKLDTLRKITDPDADKRSSVWRTSLFAGTQALENAIKRGGMRQIVRRAGAVPIFGVKADEVKEMLRGYNVTDGARKGLTELALDTARGGMGNFVEVLNMCLNYTKGGTITDEVFRSARKYKMRF